MFTRRFSFDNGGSFYKRGYVDIDGEEQALDVIPEPSTTPQPIRRIRGRVEVSCDDTEAGVRAATVLLRQLLIEFEARISDGNWLP
jgi:hypothetical protein